MNIVTRPFKQISAHREAKFVFDYEHRYSLTNVVSTDGKAVFIFNSDGVNAQEVGDYIYITLGVYKGYHKITSIPFSNWYVVETDYISDDITGTLVFIEDHVFKIAAGYDFGTLETYLPYADVALFKPEPNADGQLVVNISGYVNKLFDVINSNETVVIGAYPVYYNLFNPISVQVFEDTNSWLVATAGIESVIKFNSTSVVSWSIPSTLIAMREGYGGSAYLLSNGNVLIAAPADDTDGAKGTLMLVNRTTGNVPLFSIPIDGDPVKALPYTNTMEYWIAINDRSTTGSASRLARINTSGKITWSWGDGLLTHPTGLSVLENGTLLVSE